MRFTMRILGFALLPLAACSMLADTLNYAGELRPLSGTCDPASQAVLTLRSKAIIFAPASGTIFLHGELNGRAADADLILTDPNKHPYPLSFRGTLSGRTISGTYITPRCRYAVTLKLTSD